MSEWISVKEKLPPKGATVLACDDCGDIYTTRFSQGDSWMCECNCFVDSDVRSEVMDVTHWMPLPEKPKDNSIILHFRCHECNFVDLVLQENGKNWKCPNCLISEKNTQKEDEILEVIPPKLPFGLDDKIFKRCLCEDDCGCPLASYNDMINFCYRASGVSEELLGRDGEDDLNG